MGALTEAEIFDCIVTNAKLAAEHCDDLARLPRKGPTYARLRQELKLVEGACRQAAYWRQDARWLRVGLMMEEAHRRAGEWLRGMPQPGGGRRPIPAGEMHPLFVRLAENLRALTRQMDELRTKATGRVGTVLPDQLPAPHRDTRPVQVMLPEGMTKRASGLLVPAGTA